MDPISLTFSLEHCGYLETTLSKNNHVRYTCGQTEGVRLSLAFIHLFQWLSSGRRVIEIEQKLAVTFSVAPNEMGPSSQLGCAIHLCKKIIVLCGHFRRQPDHRWRLQVDERANQHGDVCPRCQPLDPPQPRAPRRILLRPLVDPPPQPHRTTHNYPRGERPPTHSPRNSRHARTYNILKYTAYTLKYYRNIKNLHLFLTILLID